MIRRFTLKELLAMPTVESGQFDNLKYQDDTHRVWLSRMTRADGAMFDHLAHSEELVGCDWMETDFYRADRVSEKFPRTRRQMAEYLGEHFRYPTTGYNYTIHTYAINVKLRNFVFPDTTVLNKAYRFLDMEGSPGLDYVKEEVLLPFAKRYDNKYFIQQNGRSGGYFILLQKLHCAVDQGADYQTWPVTQLRERVALVKDFDYTAQAAVLKFMEFAFNNDPREFKNR